MACSSRSLLLLLQRGVAVRQLTTTTRRSLSFGRCGFFQQPVWTSATGTGCPQRLCELQPAVRSSQHPFCTKTGEPHDEYPALADYQSQTETKEVYLMKVKGLPWSCTTQDILNFFSECRIHNGLNGIHLIMDKLGRLSGQAFIELEHEVDVIKALEKHRQYLGRRYIEVFEVSESDAEAILNQDVHPLEEDTVVIMKGLPFSSNEDDILQFFSGLDIEENGITIFTNSRGKHSGAALVRFTSQEAANEALQKNREVMGNRYIEVYPSYKDRIHTRWDKKPTSSESSLSSPERTPQSAKITTVSDSETNYSAAPPPVFPQRSDVPMHYIHMRGLPFQATGEDIVKFFYPLAVSKILVECGPNGRPSGDADVYFSSNKDAVAAMFKDKMNIGHRYIELYLNSVHDTNEK